MTVNAYTLGGTVTGNAQDLTNLKHFTINSSATVNNPFLLVDNSIGTTATATFAIRSNFMKTGSVASISANQLTSGNVFNVTASLTTGNVFNILASPSGAGAGTFTSGKIFKIIAGMTTGQVASISAKNMIGTGTVFNITVAASSSTNGTADILRVFDTAGNVTASLSGYGRLGLRGMVKSRGANSSCTGVNAGGTDPRGCLDYAESYQTKDQTLSAGEVVAVDTSNPAFVQRASGSSNLIGIISTNPASLIDGNSFISGTGTAERRAGYVPVALAGRVPVNVTTENGLIMSGDRLTASASKPGYAMKATTPGMTLGIALEGFSDINSSAGQILVFVNLSYWNPPINSLSALASSSAGSLSAGTDLIATILNYLKDAVVNLKGLIVDSIQSHSVKTQDLEVHSGITTYDRTTGEAYCVYVDSGNLRTEKGACGGSSSGNTPAPSSPESQSAPTETPAPSSEVSVTPSPEATPESTPEITPAPTPDTSVSDQTTPEPATP